MGTNQSNPKAESLPKPTNKAKRVPIGGTHSLNNGSDPKSELSSEEVRQKRLEKYQHGQSKSHNRGELPTDFLKHPVNQQYGSQAYLIHILLEDLFLVTFYKESVERNSRLTFLSNQGLSAELLLFSFENIEKNIQIILNTKTYSTDERKLDFFFELYKRADHINDQEFIKEDLKNEVKRLLLIHLIQYLTKPNLFSPGALEENPMILTACSCTLYDIFYSRLIACDANFLQSFIRNLDEADFNSTLTPIFKRIFRECTKYSIENSSNDGGGIQLLTYLLSSDNRVVDFFVNHDLYMPKGSKASAMDYQKLTIFGACLSITTFPEEFGSIEKINLVLQEHRYNPNHNVQNPDNERNLELATVKLRTKIHNAIDNVYKVMECMIKANQKYKKNILDWLYNVITLNNARKEGLNTGNKLATNGWFTNFIVLLLKFCERLLEDPNKYPSWMSKIELGYLQARPLFKGMLLLNGKSNVCSGGEEEKSDQNNQPATTNSNSTQKFSLLTELIFMIAHTISLHKNVYKDFIKLSQKFVLEQQKSTSTSNSTYSYQNVKVVAYTIQLQDPYLWSHISKLLTFQIMLILHSFGISIKDLEDISSLFEKTAVLRSEDFEQKISLPFDWVQNIQEYIVFLKRISPSIILKYSKYSEILMDFALSVIKNKQWIRSPHLQQKYLEVLIAFKPTDISNIDELDIDFTPLFKTNLYYKRHLIEGIIQVFIESENMSAEYKSNQKYIVRQACCSLLDYLLKIVFSEDINSYLVEALDRMISTSFDNYLEFVISYLYDITYLLDNSVSRLIEIKANKLASYVMPTVDFSSLENFDDSKLDAPALLCFLKIYYEIGFNLIKVCPKLFLNEVILDKFTANLNNGLNILNNPKIMDLELPNLEDLKCAPKYLLKMIAQLYISLGRQDEVMQSIIEDDRNFNIKLFHETATTLNKYRLLDLDDNLKFVELISHMEQVLQVKPKK